MTNGPGATRDSVKEAEPFPWRIALLAAGLAALLAALVAGAAALEPQYELRLSTAGVQRTRTAPADIFAAALFPRLWWPLLAWAPVSLVWRRPLLPDRSRAALVVHALAALLCGTLQGAAAAAVFARSHDGLIIPRRRSPASPGRRLLAAFSAESPAFDEQPAPPAGELLDHLLARSGRRLTRIPVSQIDWIGASGPYCEVRAGGRSHLIRASLGEIEGRLDPARFIRIHRSTLVRLDRIGELKQRARGDYAVVLQDGTELNVSRARRQALTERLGPSL